MTKNEGKNNKQGLENDLIQPQTGGVPETDELGNINKIRDILFGHQIQDYENRFSKIELHFSKETSDLKNETLKRLETLETYIKNEFNVLSERLDKESYERSETDKALSSEIKDALATMNKKISQVDDHAEKCLKNLREQILEQTKCLSADIQEKYELNSRELKDAFEALSNLKVDRTALSELFISLAINLSDESCISEILSAQKK